MNTIAPETAALRLRFFFVVMASAVIVAVFAGFRADLLSARILHPDPSDVGAAARSRDRVQRVGESFSGSDAVDGARLATAASTVGWIGAGIAAAMVILVTAAVIEQLRRVNGLSAAAAGPGAQHIRHHRVRNAWSARRSTIENDPDWHKRFMLSATIVLLGAPMFRAVVHYIGRGDMAKVSIVSTLLVDAFFLPCFAYDLLTRRRIHPAYLVAFVLIVLDQIAQAKVVTWAPWINFANALQRMVA